MREVWLPSPNYSTSRGPYNKVVFHTTEGAMKIRDLGAWFAQPSAQCSSHHGADNYERGVFGAYVYENHKAWTQGNANPYCLSIELCAYASWTRSTWLNSKGILVDNAAEWLAYMVGKYNVPWTVLNNTQAQDPGVRGICQHKNFGSWGSGHHDCGDGFPMDVVIDKAKKWGSGGGTPTPPAGGIMSTSAVAFDATGHAHWACIWKDNKVNYMPPTSSSWYAVDRGSNAKDGCGIAVSGDRIIVTYVNQDNKVCFYVKNVGTPENDSSWSWGSKGGDVKV